MKSKINNKKKPYGNKRDDVIKYLNENYDLEYYTDMKSEMVKIWKSDKDRYVISTLSGDLFDMIEGRHFDHYFRRNRFRMC